GQAHGFLTKQGSATQLYEDKDSPQLIQEIDTVLQVLTAFTVFLKTLKAGFCLFDGLLNFTFDQIKRLRFRRQRRLNHKRFLLLCGDYRFLHVNIGCPGWDNFIVCSATLAELDRFAEKWRTYHYLSRRPQVAPERPHVTTGTVRLRSHSGAFSLLHRVWPACFSIIVMISSCALASSSVARTTAKRGRSC